MTKDIAPMMSEAFNAQWLWEHYHQIPEQQQGEVKPWQVAHEVWWEFMDHRYHQG